jgi:hypothetical protein
LPWDYLTHFKEVLMKFVMLVFSLFLISHVRALEVDEKLTIRILKMSDSKKTLMINRGTEDGLVEGDHAKFVISSGIVARALCAKVSPTRSVWSVYRLVNADLVIPDAVMTLKITTPVKVTKDESQAIVKDDTPSQVGSGEIGIPLAEGAEDLTAADASSLEMKSSLEDESTKNLAERSKEVVGILNISGLTSNSKVETGDDSFTTSHAYHHIGLLGELYPQREREWYSKFSLVAGLNVMRLNAQAYNGATSSNDVTELIFGANWHPTKRSSEIMEFIPYLHFSMGLGSTKSSFSPGSRDVSDSVSNSGSTSSFSLGFGYKFYASNGLGARILLDYAMRTETFQEDVNTDKHNRVMAGPRFMLGLSYRF